MSDFAKAYIELNKQKVGDNLTVAGTLVSMLI